MKGTSEVEYRILGYFVTSGCLDEVWTGKEKIENGVGTSDKKGDQSPIDSSFHAQSHDDL